ncbi:MAG: tyrosine-type recombinase/integrase [Bacteroidota bacterium]
MATVNFLYRSKKDSAPLNLRLLYRFNNQDFVIGGKTKLEVSKAYWQKQHNQKRPKDLEISNKQTEVNQELNRIQGHILKAFNNADPTTINKDWLQLQLEFYYNPPQEAKIPTNLIDYIDYYIDYRKHEIKPTSERKYRVIQRKLERFQAFRKKPILIKDVNDRFKNEWVSYLKQEQYAQNTTQRELVFIKSFCKHARFLGLETHPQLDALRLDRQKVEKIYLTFDELEKIENTTGLTEHLDNARDWLIISCYTGQRVSDFMRFTSDMIRMEEGKHLLEFTQKKTGKIMTIPLHKKVLEILDKRNGNFPRAISDQRYNDYIKDVCKEAKLKKEVLGSKKEETEKDSGKFRKKTKLYKKWELVTSHIGRRSFATNFYGSLPTSYLIYITGHSTEAMFRAYIGKSNKDMALEIAKYF